MRISRFRIRYRQSGCAGGQILVSEDIESAGERVRYHAGEEPIGIGGSGGWAKRVVGKEVRRYAGADITKLRYASFHASRKGTTNCGVTFRPTDRSLLKNGLENKASASHEMLCSVSLPHSGIHLGIRHGSIQCAFSLSQDFVKNAGKRRLQGYTERIERIDACTSRLRVRLVVSTSQVVKSTSNHYWLWRRTRPGDLTRLPGCSTEISPC